MNKAKFFKICNSCDKQWAHQLSIATGRAYREMDNIIYITGSTWCRGGLSSYELYRPTPGRQGRGDAPYKVANAAIAKQLPKFQRWLEEWRAANLKAEWQAATNKEPT